MHEGRDDCDRDTQHNHRARARHSVGPEVEPDDQRDARRVHDCRAARDHTAPLQHHAPQHAQDHRQQKEHARHRRLLQAVLVPLPRESQKRAHDQAQGYRREQHLRRRAPGRRHGEHRKIHAEHLRGVRKLVPEQCGRQVVVPRGVCSQHAITPALRVRRVVHPHEARQQRAARKRHHTEHVVHHDRTAPRCQRQRKRLRNSVRVRVHHRRLVHVPVHERHRRRPVELAEERVSEEDGVERDREHADVQDHGLARELPCVHALEQPAAARALVDQVHKVAADVRHLPAYTHQA